MRIDWFSLYLNVMAILHVLLFLSSFWTGIKPDGWFSVQLCVCIVGMCLYERIKVAQNLLLRFDDETTQKEVVSAIKAVLYGKGAEQHD